MNHKHQPTLFSGSQEYSWQTEHTPTLQPPLNKRHRRYSPQAIYLEGYNKLKHLEYGVPNLARNTYLD